MATVSAHDAAALRDFEPAHVRFGSGADIAHHQANVRFTPESGQRADGSVCPLCAISRQMAVQQIAAYSITSSAATTVCAVALYF
jgi:hypothetical protein